MKQKNLHPIVTKNRVTGYLLFVLLTLFLAGCNQQHIELYSPSEGIIIPDNTPALSWSPVDCNYYTIRIDGIVMDTVLNDMNACVPFPLSFGEHAWKVVAHTNKADIESETGTFSIDDSPLQKLPESSQLLRMNWKVKSSLLLAASGADLSAPQVNTENWHATSVPVTVLSALVRNGIYPNPYKGLNNMCIPDINDEYNAEHDLLQYSHIPGENPWKAPYWFRTSFNVSDTLNGEKIWLNFGEINYRAEVWLNGSMLADSTTMLGMERNFRFDVTSLVHKDKQNHLAVAIFPVDIHGKPAEEPLTPLGAPGTNMADGLISKNYTKWDVLGWDWQPAIRDRDMGITEDVFLSSTNSIELKNIYVTSDLPLPDTSSAKLSVSVDVKNNSQQTKEGIVSAVILYKGSEISISQSFSVDPFEEKTLLWNSQLAPVLHVQNPKLWWPHDYGIPNLYTISFSATIKNQIVATAESSFGIREVDSYIGANERVFKVNGKDIYCKGGNWVMDMMLNWNAKRYEDEILLSKNANLNILRVWGPTGVPPKAFYEAADRHGMLLWQDFLNDYWGTFRNTPGYTPEDDLYEKITIEIVKKYRNHPSLIIWCGGNEGVNPREELITEKILPTYDGRDSKFYLKTSNGHGLHGGGPYHTIAPDEYFTNPKLDGFSSEIGPSGVPVYESVRKFMSNLGEDYMKERFPINKVWAYHDANDWPGEDKRKFSSYDNLLRDMYGPQRTTDIAGVKEYFSKAQLINYDVYRASMEAINKQLWTNASGILLWKSNSSWPSMVWQLYDWYKQSHAGYFGCQAAAEPVHIQFNRDTKEIAVLNTRYKNQEDVFITGEMYTVNLQKVWDTTATLDLHENNITNTGIIVPLRDEITFLKLAANDAEGNQLSNNFYWLHRNNDFTALDQLPQAKIIAEAVKTEINGRTIYSLTISNNGDNLAFMIDCRLEGKNSGTELLPTLWSNDYVSLLPGKSVKLTAEIDNSHIIETPVISCKAFNMNEKIIIALD